MTIFRTSSLINSSRNNSFFVFFLLVIFCVVSFPEYYASASSVQDETILFAGDSDIEYWKNTNSIYPNSVNKGDGGTTCKQWVNRIDKWIDKYQPTTVVLVCGENDLYSNRDAEKTFQDFLKVVKKIATKNSSTRVIYMGTKSEPGTKSLHPLYREYDALIRNYYGAEQQQQDGSRFIMIDVYPSFEALGNPTSFYKRDRLHLSKEGYGYWNTWLQLELADGDSDCLRWESGDCVLTSTNDNNPDNPTSEPSSASSSTSSSTSTCADDPDFRYKGMKNKDCEWVGKKKRKRCYKRYDQESYLWQWCPESCGDC